MKSSLGSTTRDRLVPLYAGLLIMPAVRAWCCARGACAELAIRGARPRPRQGGGTALVLRRGWCALPRQHCGGIRRDQPTPELVHPVHPRRCRTRLGPTVQQCVAARHREAGTCGTRPPHRRLGRPLCLSHATCPLSPLPLPSSPLMRLRRSRLLNPLQRQLPPSPRPQRDLCPIRHRDSGTTMIDAASGLDCGERDQRAYERNQW
jgi:hypothetical protein